MARDGQTTQAWSEHFIIRRMGEELLIYDLRNQQVTSLNAFAAQVWHASNGDADAHAVADKLSADGNSAATARDIERALNKLQDVGLLKNAAGPVQVKSHDDSRRAFFGSALCVMATTAAVVTVMAPTPASAASSACGPCAAPTPVCNTFNGECVECLVSEDCPNPAAPTCANNECSSGGI